MDVPGHEVVGARPRHLQTGDNGNDMTNGVRLSPGGSRGAAQRDGKRSLPKETRRNQLPGPRA
jgi:hypothetical protein